MENLEKELDYINDKLDIIYGDNNPMLTLYGDGSWSVEIDDFSITYGYYRTNANQGDSIKQLYNFINGK